MAAAAAAAVTGAARLEQSGTVCPKGAHTRHAGRDLHSRNRRVFRDQHRLHLRVWKALSHGKHSRRTRGRWAAGLPVRGDAATGEVLAAAARA